MFCCPLDPVSPSHTHDGEQSMVLVIGDGILKQREGHVADDDGIFAQHIFIPQLGFENTGFNMVSAMRRNLLSNILECLAGR